MQNQSVLGCFEGFLSLARSTSTDAGGNTNGSFSNLKITAEKLPKEQASSKTDLEMVHTKLRRATEQINLLEGKLQQAVNENAKLKVKQTEDSKLWQGLDPKVSSMKTLCDQLTETLQKLSNQSQTERAEEDKELFAEKRGNNSAALDEFNCLLHDLSTKLEFVEQAIMSGKQQMLQMKHEKEEIDQSYKGWFCATDTTIKEKDSLIKQLEGSVDESKARLQCLEQGLKLKDDVCIRLKENLASAGGEKNSLRLRNQGRNLETAKLCKDNKDLNDLCSSFVAKVTELDKEHASGSSHVSRLLSSFERSQGTVQEEEILIARSAMCKLMSQNNGLKIEIEELKSRITELHKTQEIVMVQQVEECQVAEDKIRRLESEAEISASNTNRFEKLGSELQGRIQKLLEDSTVTENHKQELLENISKLESDNQELVGKEQSITYEKSINADSLQGERAKRDQVGTLESQVNQLYGILDDKEQPYSCSVEREKTLEEQKLQVEASLSATECQLTEAKKQYDLMLEGKQIELSKHLKELCSKNDKAISDIHKKYELEHKGITIAEKSKAEKLIREMESKCHEKISENKKGSESYLMQLKEEHGTMVARIQQDNEQKESTLRAYHKEELQLIQSQSKNELRERFSLLRKEHEFQIKSLRIQHEEECQRLQEELELQKSEEEKRRALLQLQRKVMEGNQHVDEEVDSKKQYSVPEIKMHDPYGRKEHELWSVSPESKQKDVNLFGILQSPIPNMLSKGDEVETENGRITKEKETGSITMFREPKTWRSFHSTTPLSGSRKKRMSKKMSRVKRKRVSNTATIVLDPNDWHASGRSYRKGIRKAQAWYRAEGRYVDLADHLGEGFGVFTTPAEGTFHMRIRCMDRELTFYLHGRDVYLKGWTGGKFGTFEIQSESDSESDEEVVNYIQEPLCKILKTGVNYHDLCADLGKVRIGPAMMDSFEVLYRCNGVKTGAVVEAISVFSVSLAEPIRCEDVLDKVCDCFVHYRVDTLDTEDSCISYWVRNYEYYSKVTMKAVNCYYEGKPVIEITDKRDKSVIPLKEIIRKYPILLRDALNEGKFEHEKTHTPTLCPVYSEAEEDDENLEDHEDKKQEAEEEEEMEKKAQSKDQMVSNPNQSGVLNGSIVRFSGARSFCNMSYNVQPGFRAGSAGLSRRCFHAPSGIIKVGPVAGSIPRWVPDPSTCRKLFRAARCARWRFL